MGSFFSKIYNLLFGPNYYKVLMLGLDFSIKTTILIVIDSNDKERLEEAIESFEYILKADELKNLPILIMANKQDLNETLSPDEITLFL